MLHSHCLFSIKWKSDPELHVCILQHIRANHAEDIEITVQDILDVVKSKQWLSTNPDSVDGLPSLHLNLITNGKPLFDINDSVDDLTTFPQCIRRLHKD